MQRVAILWRGDAVERSTATAGNNRFSAVFHEFERYGVEAEPAVFDETFADEVRYQLSRVDGVLVWVNPLQDGAKDRSVVDAMLRDAAAHGVFVSTHPDTILKLGTKEVLYRTREMSWGGDIDLYTTLHELRQRLPLRLANGGSRVLKQNRGNSGNGVWRVEWAAGTHGSQAAVRVIHARKGSVAEEMPLPAFIGQCAAYFTGDGQMVDQPFHSPVPDGMVRCYLSHGQVVGFGHQYVTALLREPRDVQPRIYHPDTQPEFQELKVKMETEWVPQLQHLLEIPTESLPILWDADFLYGSKTDTGAQTYVLCEINVSAVYPYPESATAYLVKNAVARMQNRLR